MIKILTAGNSHSQKLIGIMDGLPAGIEITKKYIREQLARRRNCIGRSQRQKKEDDNFEIISGLNSEEITTGSPVGILIYNKQKKYNKDFIIRPGHAELSGMLKYGLNSIEDVRERASARETVARTALYSFCLKFISALGIKIKSQVIILDGHKIRNEKEAEDIIEKNEDRSLGGVFEVKADNLPIGLGSFNQQENKLTHLIYSELGSINAIKGVEIGDGFLFAKALKGGDEFEIYNNRILRKTNTAGGIEGGMTNGENLIIRCAVKPVPGIKKGLDSFDYKTKDKAISYSYTSDLTAVFAASIYSEYVLSYILSNSIIQKFGGDSLKEIKERVFKWNKKNKSFFKLK